LTELDRKKEQTPVPKEWAYAPAPESRDVVSIEDRYGHFVGGQWLEPSEIYTTISPATEETLAEVGQATPEEVEGAVTAAREAFENGWSGIAPAERAKYLGACLTIWRLLRCQPFHPGGIDHVPPRRTPTATK